MLGMVVGKDGPEGKGGVGGRKGRGTSLVIGMPGTCWLEEGLGLLGSVVQGPGCCVGRRRRLLCCCSAGSEVWAGQRE